jgi:hypothetical protein
MFTCLEVIQTASRALIDDDHVRWTLPELLDHINDAVRAIISAKPNAKTDTVTLELVQGTLQTLPDEYPILARVTRNIITAHDEIGGPVGGVAIRMVAGRDKMDSFFPGWQSDAALFSSIVRHVIYDDADLRHFYVIPGNTGAGRIEAVVGVMPATLAPPGDPALEATYAVEVPLPDTYRTPVCDYVLFRAFSKDQGIPQSEARAAKHFSAFQAALGVTTSSQSEISAARVPANRGA